VEPTGSPTTTSSDAGADSSADAGADGATYPFAVTDSRPDAQRLAGAEPEANAGLGRATS
jgi:hypothetical protein